MQFLDTIDDAFSRGSIVPRGFVYDTVLSHDQTIGNYVWLQPKFGKLLWVEFEEPAGSGNWRHYDTFYWGRHGAVVDHNPEVLIEEHMREFVYPETRSISLRFWFQLPGGKVTPLAPTREFYELEAEYFRKQDLCNPNYRYKPHTDVNMS